VMGCEFFVSSRRRHTMFSRDWSSDVCSSDLEGELFVIASLFVARRYRAPLDPATKNMGPRADRIVWTQYPQLWCDFSDVHAYRVLSSSSRIPCSARLVFSWFYSWEQGSPLSIAGVHHRTRGLSALDTRAPGPGVRPGRVAGRHHHQARAARLPAW